MDTELMKDTIVSTIMNAISEIMEEDEIACTLSLDSDLINDVGLDSIQLINMILNLEDNLDIVIDFDDFDFDEINTIGCLAEFLKGLKEDVH